MSRKVGLASAAAVALIVSALNIPVAAQSADDSPEMRGGPMHGGMMAGRHGMHCPMMGMMRRGKPRTEGRIAFLKAELNIKAGQEKAWNAYADTLRDIHKARAGKKGRMGRGMMREDGERKPAPEMLQAHITMMENMLGHLKKLQAATADLYEGLDSSQKATADELLSRPCAPM